MMRWLVRLPRVISEVIRDELASSSKVTLDRNESFAVSRNRSCTTLFSYQQRQENKAKLACLAGEYQFRFHSQLCVYTSICAFPGNGTKNACWHLQVSPLRDSDDARRRCNTRFIEWHKPSNHICARIKSHVYWQNFKCWQNFSKAIYYELMNYHKPSYIVINQD